MIWSHTVVLPLAVPPAWAAGRWARQQLQYSLRGLPFGADGGQLADGIGGRSAPRIGRLPTLFSSPAMPRMKVAPLRPPRERPLLGEAKPFGWLVLGLLGSSGGEEMLYPFSGMFRTGVRDRL